MDGLANYTESKDIDLGYSADDVVDTSTSESDGANSNVGRAVTETITIAQTPITIRKTVMPETPDEHSGGGFLNWFSKLSFGMKFGLFSIPVIIIVIIVAWILLKK